jgi:alkylated DNA repair dioxygenase AlkB
MDIGEGDSYLIKNIIPDDLLKELGNDTKSIFNSIKDDINWKNMYRMGLPVPRMVASMGDEIEIDSEKYQPIYRHPADEMPILDKWSKNAEKLKDCVSKKVSEIFKKNISFNHALIQYYKDGSDHITEHSDKTLDMKIGLPVVNLSFGATRLMVLKSKDKSKVTQRIDLPNNSLFILGWETNKKWYHSIRHDKRPLCEKREDELICNEQRISFTFRQIATFITSDGDLFGQGAIVKRFEDIDKKREKINDQDQLVLAFSEENLKTDFDWEKWYGNGFDSICLKNVIR